MIELTTPFSPGDLHPGKSYTHMRVTAVGVQSVNNRIRLTLVYAYNDGTWAIGVTPPVEISIDRDDFHALKKLKAKKANGDILREFFKACEQFAVDQGVVDGTISNDEDPFLDDPPPEVKGDPDPLPEPDHTDDGPVEPGNEDAAP